MIRFACPACKSVMEARDDRAGQMLGCPRCRKSVQVPRPARVATPVQARMPAPVAKIVPGPAPAGIAVAPPRSGGGSGRKVLLLGAVFAILILAAAGYAIVQTVSGDSKPPPPVAAPEPKEPETQWKVAEEQPSTPALRNIDEIIVALKSKQADVRFQAVRELNRSTRVGRSAAVPLAALLGDRADTTVALETRKLAARCLGKIGPDAEAVVPQMADALADPNKEVRLLILDALGRVGRAGIPPVTAALRSADPSVQTKAASVLGGYGKDAAASVPALMALVEQSDQDRRLQFASEVVKIDPAQTGVIKYLLVGLKDSNDSNRRLACIALGTMGPHAKEAENDLFDTYSGDVNQSVRDAAEDAVRAIRGEK